MVNTYYVLWNLGINSLEKEELQSFKINIIKNIKLLLEWIDKYFIISNNLKAQFVSIVAKTTWFKAEVLF